MWSTFAPTARLGLGAVVSEASRGRLDIGSRVNVCSWRVIYSQRESWFKAKRSIDIRVVQRIARAGVATRKAAPAARAAPSAIICMGSGRTYRQQGFCTIRFLNFYRYLAKMSAERMAAGAVPAQLGKDQRGGGCFRGGGTKVHMLLLSLGNRVSVCLSISTS